MSYNINALENELQSALKEFSLFSFSEDGVKLVAKAGDNFISRTENELTICYTTKARFVYSLFLFDTLGKVGDTGCEFENLSGFVDMSRNAVRTVETVKAFMRQLVLMGYTEFQIYMEDTYEIPEEPYFGYKRGRYTQAELKEIVAYGKKIGLKCIPAIQTLAHLNAIARWRTYQLSVIDTGDILLVDEPRTYELIENMFRSLRECFDCEELHLGMDEAHMVGLGRYLDKHGYSDRSTIIVRHLQRVVELARKYGFTKPIMWNDMFVRLVNKGNLDGADVEVSDEIMKMVPENITLACWNYYRLDTKFYTDMISIQKKFKRPVCFASGIITWLGITPMNEFSIRQNKFAMKACKAQGVNTYMVTIWGDDGAECSPFAALPGMARVAAMANNLKEYKPLFERMTGIKYDKFMRIDSPNQIAKLAELCSLAQPARYMLYNDCLQGLYDSTVTEGDGEKYRSVALKLHQLGKNSEWGYLFKTQESLAKVMLYKYELTIKTRKAYQAKDKAALKSIVDNDYAKLLKALDVFYKDFHYQWYKENKPYGFEVQDYRLGGLKQRLCNARGLIKDYLCGKLDSLPELEENVLSAICEEEMNGGAIDERGFTRQVTANVFSI